MTIPNHFDLLSVVEGFSEVNREFRGNAARDIKVETLCNLVQIMND
jgi:hypothetical protein